MTWQLLIQNEPRLLEIEKWVKSLDPKDPAYSDLQAYADMKKRVEKIVGWHREPRNMSAIHPKLQMLHGSKAYDAAIKHLYDLIPMEPVHEEMDQ